MGRDESWKQVAIVAALLLTGPLAYMVGKKVRKSFTGIDVPPDWIHG